MTIKEKARRLAKVAIKNVEYLIKPPEGYHPSEFRKEFVEGTKDGLLRKLEKTLLEELKRIDKK